MKHQTSARWRISYWIIATVLLALLAVILTTRTFLFSRIEEDANATVEQEVSEFRAFVESGTDPQTAAPFTTSRRMMEVYLSRQIVSNNQAIFGMVDGQLIQMDLSGNSGSHVREVQSNSSLVSSVLQSDNPSGVYKDSELGQVHWGRVAVTTSGPHGQPESHQDQGQFKYQGSESVFVVAVFTEPSRSEVSGQMGSIALVGAGGLAVTSFIAWLVAGQILAPLRDLRRVAASITDSDLSQRVPVVGHDEIAQLAQTFNGMLDRLERSYRDQRQFVDDAGHELRTPITVIRGQLELLNDASYEERERSISLTIDELDRMARIVNDLLTLAIADSADFVHPTMVDAAELTIDIEDKTHVMATRTIRLTAVAEGMVYVDEQRITQAMLELFNNAIRHTTDNDAIEIGSAFIGQGENRILRLWIRDFGPGIPADVLPGLFERFSRGRGSIKRHNGAGLGLSIVRAIADAHDGSAWVESSEGYGATFGLDLPAGRPYDGDDQGTVS